MEQNRIDARKMWQVLFKREFYIDMAVFVFVCMASVFVILFLSVKLDSHLGFSPFIGHPWDVLFSLFFATSGAFIIWRAYAYLVFAGEGSPCPQMGGTKKLVTTGPYSVVRHPSVVGKFFGILALGLLSGSVTFTFMVIPALSAWSVFYNRFIQEKGCVERFGKDYIEYRRRVPMFIPKLSKR